MRINNKAVKANVTVRTERIITVSVTGESHKISLIRKAAYREAVGYCVDLNKKIDMKLSPREITSTRTNMGRETSLVIEYMMG